MALLIGYWTCVPTLYPGHLVHIMPLDAYGNPEIRYCFLFPPISKQGNCGSKKGELIDSCCMAISTPGLSGPNTLWGQTAMKCFSVLGLITYHHVPHWEIPQLKVLLGHPCLGDYCSYLPCLSILNLLVCLCHFDGNKGQGSNINIRLPQFPATLAKLLKLLT